MESRPIQDTKGEGAWAPIEACKPFAIPTSSLIFFIRVFYNMSQAFTRSASSSRNIFPGTMEYHILAFDRTKKTGRFWRHLFWSARDGWVDGGTNHVLIKRRYEAVGKSGM